MRVPHTDVNSAFSGIGTTSDDWIEVFYSRPSWAVCQICYSVDAGTTWEPFGKFQMIDASNIRNGFRAFRIRATQLQFRLANGDQSMVDDNNGCDFVIESSGRYVVHPGASSGSGLTRVSDVQLPDVLRPLRPTDSTIELVFTTGGSGSSSWRSAYVVYIPVASRDALSFSNASSTEEWLTLPMNKSAVHLQHGPRATWTLCIDAQFGIDCAFNDGGNEWDSNQSQNYKIRLPGRYSIGNGYLQYEGVAQLDMHSKTAF